MSVKYKNGKLTFVHAPSVHAVAGRFAVRTDGTLLLGHGLGGELAPGHVYEIRKNLMDSEFHLKDLGPSALREDALDRDGTVAPYGAYWASSPEHILEVGGGVHLLTREEWLGLCPPKETTDDP